MSIIFAVLVFLVSNLIYFVTCGSSTTPQVRIYPWNFTKLSNTELSLSLGENLQLSCELKNVNYKFSLEWYLPHSQGRNVNITKEKGRSILQVNNISKADTGPYKCVPHFGENQDFPEIRSAQLMLYVKTSSGMLSFSRQFDFYLLDLISRKKNNRHFRV